MSPLSMADSGKLNPISKALLLVMCSVLVLLISDPVHMSIVVVCVLVTKERYQARGVMTKGIIGFAATIFLAQVIFNHSGDELVSWSVLGITTGGVYDGVSIAGKFLSLIMMSWVFVATTTPSELSSALTTTGFPYRYAFLPALSMRFVPVFRFELATVREAQVTRGMRLDKSLRGVIRSARYTTTPMLMTAMSKVNSLAASMSGRGFGVYEKRTQLKPLRMTAFDIAFVAFSATMVVLAYLVTRCPSLQIA
ncbi:MAG: energy-coupling factor transporter transmembrane protein EcfT [Thermoplasmata archaeon]